MAKRGGKYHGFRSKAQLSGGDGPGRRTNHGLADMRMPHRAGRRSATAGSPDARASGRRREVEQTIATPTADACSDSDSTRVRADG